MNFFKTLPSQVEASETSRSGFPAELLRNSAETRTLASPAPRVIPALTPEQLKLRNMLLLAREQQGVRSVLVTGASEGVGATAVATTLALGLSLDQQKEVLLVDANQQRPSLHQFFQLKMSEGITTAAGGGATFLEMAVVAGIPNLHVIPSGGALLGARFDAKHFIAVAPALGEAFDFVIVDAPPLNLNPDILVLGMHLNSAILVAEAERTRIEEVREIAAELARAKVRLLGVVLNRHKEELPSQIKRWFQ